MILDPIQWILAVIDTIVRLSIAGTKGAHNHAKHAHKDNRNLPSHIVWRSVPRPDV